MRKIKDIFRRLSDIPQGYIYPWGKDQHTTQVVVTPLCPEKIKKFHQ